MSPDPLLHLAVALDGAGWHPAAWREPDARPEELFRGRYWADLVAEAEDGLLDFVTIEDSFGVQSTDFNEVDDRVDQVRGRLDAVLTAARAAPATTHVGIVPTVVASHTEPFHLSKAIATLDYAAAGRAGLRVQISAKPYEYALIGRRTTEPVRLADINTAEVQARIADHFSEAADYVEVVRRLWDSWEDDAEIRDAATGRFIDREKLHHIDFEGDWFDVRGPSITPRPPQGQPVVTALGHSSIPYQLIARAADVGFVTPHDRAGAAAIVAEIRREQEFAGRASDTVHVFGDLVVFLDESTQAAQERRARLDEAAGEPYTSDAYIFAGTPSELADLLADWRHAGLTGYRLRPAALPHDLTRITRALVPELQARGLFRTEYQASTLRGHLGLPRPANRYAAVAPAAAPAAV
ncbi:LLM class flavin-dependent oxidoreductase [Catenulispora sp. NF23]|uniref:LLM class flavin-dependent oxidoreductase n=1 Tax=Catenulispora pinistramenti TaxID=2705254 RepID=A0ABS5L3T9_9ACTN|nr:LLM class flavin-dependent oxidoreductase [Catenulispora pinistramenti]MBS2537357.1 LLM class flavin-dependent oxidoreductase [Catenulispora pinistramenti]MBS2552895.1 LLM class flavin-dependent oxidoreductase [Catenulispora pinistramenti]